MPVENIIVNTEFRGNLPKTASELKSAKTELREITNLLSSGALSGDALIKATKRAGELRDTIDDTQNLIKAFNPEAKFQAFASVIGGVANGFQVAQGAAALFGQQNEKLEQAILKTQGAMALAQGLNGLLGMKDSLVILGKQVQATIPFLRQFSAALLGAVTGGIAIALTLIVAYWKDISKWLGIATESQEEYNKRVDEQIAQNQKAQEQFRALRDLRISLIKDETKRAAAERKAQADDLKASLREQNALRQGSATAINETLKEIDRKYEQDKEKIEKEGAQKREALRLNNLEDRIKAENIGFDEELKLFDLQTKRLLDQAKIENRETKKVLSDRLQERLELETKIQDQIRQKYADALADRLSNIENFNQAEQNSIFKSLDTQRKAIDAYYKYGKISKQQYTDAVIALDKAELNARLEVASASANVLGAISQLAGEATAQGKALGVASAVIDTYVGANKALAQGGILGFLGAAAVIATGLANVKRILKVKVPGSSSSAPSIPQASSSTPPRIGSQSNITQLVNGNEPVVTRQLDVQTQKVIVTETDITKTQGKVRKTESKATVG